MTAIGTYNMVARTATTFTFAGQVTTGTTPIDFETYSAVFTARPFYNSPIIWVTLSTPEIVLTANGNVSFTIPNEVMATIAPNTGKYDIVIRNAEGQDEYVLEGDFVVTPAVTQDV